MSVWVVICTDPADRGSECWTHGVYESKETARRVYNRLIEDGYLTVRIDRKRVYPKRSPR